MSALVEMSRAIRGVLERYGPTLSAIPSPTLAELEKIVTTYSLDLKDEMERRVHDRA